MADIEALRLALGARRLTLDGVSYGSFVAERYALTYRKRVVRLVLDSVVPQQGVDPLYLAAIRATARVLREVCAQQGCRWDPGRDPTRHLPLAVGRLHWAVLGLELLKRGRCRVVATADRLNRRIRLED